MGNSRRAKKFKKTKKQSKLSKILSSGYSKKEAQYHYLNDLSASEVRANVNNVLKHHYFKSALNLTKTASLSNMYSSKTVGTSLDRNIAWCLGLVEVHKADLQFALDLENEITAYILANQYNEALNDLNTIDSLCGVSIWSISIRGSLERRLGDEIHEGNTVTSVLDGANENQFLNYISRYVADYFNDSKIYFTSTNSLFLEINRCAHSDLRDFLLYRLLHVDSRQEYDFNKVFNVEKNSSIIDVLFLLIDFALYCLSDLGKQLYSIETFVRLSRTLNSLFDYPTINGLANFSGIKSDWEYESSVQNIIDLYTKGEYEQVCIKANAHGLFRFDFSVLELIVKANIRAPKLLLIDDKENIINHMESVLLRNDSFRSSLEYLACLANSFRSLRWFNQLGYFVERESSFVATSDKDYFDGLIFLCAESSTPRKSKVVHDSLKEEYFTKISSRNDNDSVSIKMYENLIQKFSKCDFDSLGVESSRAQKYLASNLVDEGQYENAIRIYRNLSQSTDELISIESTRLLVDVLLLSGKNEEAINCFVEASLSNKNLFTIFDTNTVLQRAKRLAKNNKNINISIAYSLHSRFSNSKYDSSLKFSFETFLKANSAKYPQDLFGMEDLFGRERLYYFFQWICTPEVMKLYFEFEDLREIEECRLLVCSYLMENGVKSEGIQNEVKEINKLHLIKRAARKVENSRIYVDTSTFLGRNSQQYRALFDRYCELCSEDHSSSIDDENFSSLIEKFKGNDLEGINYFKTLSVIYLPHVRLSLKNSTFLKLAALLRTEFAYGERGLNNHLSTRIRHGVLPTAFRKPIVDEELYVQKTLKLETFKESSKWSVGQIPFDNNEIEHIWIGLQKFSEAYEALISEINDEWLQIYTLELAASSISNDEKQNALFDYSISPLECFALQQKLPISPSYDDFINEATQWLWSRTEYILTDVQNRIRATAKDRANELLDLLKEGVVRDLGQGINVSEFCNSVDRSKSALSNQVEVICSWFTHVDIDEDEEFDIETALEIAKRSLNLSVDFNSLVNCRLSEKGLKYFVDIFFILLENAISKSKLAKDELIVKIVLDRSDDNQLKLYCTNNCNISSTTEEYNASLNFYREAYGDESLIKGRLQDEGGSGFFKIWKILAVDLETQHDIQFKLDDTNLFTVRIDFNESKNLRVL